MMTAFPEFLYDYGRIGLQRVNWARYLVSLYLELYRVKWARFLVRWYLELYRVDCARFYVISCLDDIIAALKH